MVDKEEEPKTETKKEVPKQEDKEEDPEVKKLKIQEAEKEYEEHAAFDAKVDTFVLYTVLFIIALIFLVVAAIINGWTFVASIFFIAYNFFKQYGVIFIVVVVILWIIHKERH
jgi:uncharacterized membrane protein|tara:strand:- start:90 stop:428 length:339 start_codon:yes stop_codon:yes gene_type:complete